MTSATINAKAPSVPASERNAAGLGVGMPAPGTWTQTPKWPVASGVVAKLGRDPLRVYVTLLCMSRHGLVSGKWHDDIAEVSGLSTRQVRRAIETLDDAGMIRRLPTGFGRGFNVNYQIIFAPEAGRSCPTSDDKQGARVLLPDPGSRAPVTAKQDAGVPEAGRRCPKSRAPVSSLKKDECKDEESSKTGTPSPTPTPADPRAVAAALFLESEGIRGAGLQSLLTAYPELTPDDCEECFNEEDLGDGAGPGMKVTAIRNHAAAVIAGRKEREAQAAADRAQLGAALEKLAAAAAGLNGKLPTLKISGHTRMMLGARVLALLTAAGAPTWNAREWAGAVPADDPQAQAVFALAKHAEDDERRAADAECERQRREWEAGEPARRAEREKHEATQREAQARAEAAAAEKAAQAQRWVDAANAVRTMPDDEVLALWARTMTGEAVSEHYRRAHAGDEVTPDVLRREHGRRDAMTEQLLADRRALEVAA